MREVFISSDNIISPIGLTTADNFQQLKQNVSGVQLHEDKSMSDQPFQAALFKEDPGINNKDSNSYTRFETLLISSIADALGKSSIKADDKRTVLILSSTKGNISLLETEEASGALNQRISLNTSAKLVAAHFGFANQPLIVSRPAEA